MKTFWVNPKMAGMESSAKRMSVPPIATMTRSMGVMERFPSTSVNSRSPSKSSEVWNTLRASLTTMLSPECASSDSGLIMLPAVMTRTRPKM